MSRRRVTHSQKGRDGHIYGLYGPSFGFLSMSEIAADIRNDRHRYYVREGPHESEIHVFEDEDGEALVSTRNPLSPNHLLALPDF